MQPTQLERFRQYKKKTLSIGVTVDGAPVRAVPVPWERPNHAFNMRTPDIYFSIADMQDESVLKEIEGFKVVGFYAFDEMPDYSVLARFTELQDIAVYNGRNLKNLSFLRNNRDWFMLYLEDAVIEDTADLFACERTFLHGFALAMKNCTFGDISALENERRMKFSELLLWRESKDEYMRWQKVPHILYRYNVIEKDTLNEN